MQNTDTKPMSLLKTIEGFLKMTDMVRVRRINKAQGLLTKDYLIKIAMTKGIFDVKLLNSPRVRCGYVEDDTNSGWFDDRAKSLIKINARQLGVTANNPTCLVVS